MSVLSLQNLSKVYRDAKPKEVAALRSLNLDLDARELLVVVGPSGCGKTTMLRLIAGLEEATEGKIFLEKRDLHGVSAKDRDIAMVFQSHALFPHLNVFENIGFGLKLRKLPRQEIEDRVLWATEMLGIRDKLKAKPEDLSGGEAQRAALGRALVRRPKLFLLDEPLSNLDMPTRIQLRCEIAKLQHELGVPMLYVTHDQTEALKLGHRIAVLRKGELQQVGSPSEIVQKPATEFVSTFFSPG